MAKIDYRLFSSPFHHPCIIQHIQHSTFTKALFAACNLGTAASTRRLSGFTAKKPTLRASPIPPEVLRNFLRLLALHRPYMSYMSYMQLQLVRPTVSSKLPRSSASHHWSDITLGWCSLPTGRAFWLNGRMDGSFTCTSFSSKTWIGKAVEADLSKPCLWTSLDVSFKFDMFDMMTVKWKGFLIHWRTLLNRTPHHSSYPPETHSRHQSRQRHHSPQSQERLSG